MKTTRITDGGIKSYVVTGYTVTNKLVQYTLFKNGHGWTTESIYGEGVDFHQLFPTKAEAVVAINNQG